MNEQTKIFCLIVNPTEAVDEIKYWLGNSPATATTAVALNAELAVVSCSFKTGRGIVWNVKDIITNPEHELVTPSVKTGVSTTQLHKVAMKGNLQEVLLCHLKRNSAFQRTIGGKSQDMTKMIVRQQREQFTLQNT